MKRMKKFLAGILALTCMFSAISMTACKDDKDAVQTDVTLEDTNGDAAGETPGETPDNGTGDAAGETPGETPDNGTGDTAGDGAGEDIGDSTSGGIVVSSAVHHLRAGGTYAFSKNVAFLSTDVVATSSTYTPVTSTLTAKVEPIDADQRVDWTYEFVNASSTWAKGKTLTDYMTIAPKSDGSTSLDVTCKQPFGEQIKITCTSRANNTISASTVVDFLSIGELKTVTFGSGNTAITVNLGGESTVKWDIEGGTVYGGLMELGDIEKKTDGGVCTKSIDADDFVIEAAWLDVPGIYYKDSSIPHSHEDDYLIAEVRRVVSFYEDDIGVEKYGLREGSVFMSNYLFDLLYIYKDSAFSDKKPLKELDLPEVIEVMSTLSENSLYTFIIRVTVLGAVREYQSLLKLEIV